MVWVGGFGFRVYDFLDLHEVGGYFHGKLGLV